MDIASSLNWLFIGAKFGVPLALVFGLPAWLILRDARRSQAEAEAAPLLRARAAWLTGSVLVAAMGHPVLGLPGGPDWQSSLSFAVGSLVLVCGCAALGIMPAFYHRAMTNINSFAGKPLCSPNLAIVAMLPGLNLVVLPLVWCDAHYYSRRLFLGSRVSWRASAMLSITTIVLVLIALAVALIGWLHPDGDPEMQNRLSHGVMSGCAATAGALLLARMIRDIRDAQDCVAAQWSGQQPPKSGSAGRRVLEPLRWGAVALLIAVGAGTALVSSLNANSIPPARDAAAGQSAGSPAAFAVLQTLANSINKAGRAQLDQVTWLEAAKVERGVFVYEYSVALNPLPNAEILQFLQRVQPNIIRGYCTDASFKVFRDLRTTVVFRYTFADRTPLGQVNASLSDCQK